MSNLNKVVFPAPFGPITPTIPAGGRLKDKLSNKSLFSNDWLESLTDDQLYDVFEEFIELPGLSHIGYQKPVKPRPDSNIYDLPITDEWWNIKPEPEEEI